MKKIFSILLLMSAGIHFTNAQSSVAIGDSNPKASAVLYLKGNGSQGLIIPIVANTTSIAAPESGMIVYNSSDKKVYYHDGAAWITVGSGSAGGSTYTLSLSGNNLLLKDATSTVSTVPITATAPTAANQFLTWDGSKWVATTFSQDATNANGVITVKGIQGKALPALPTTTQDQVLVYNGTAWNFQALTGGTDSQDLSLNTTTNALSLTNDATPVDLTPYKQSLAITGSSLSISGGNSVTIPGTTYTGGTGITVAGTTITNTGDTNPADDITTASTAAGDVTGLFSNLQIASGSVTTTEIADGTIAAADLGAMSASNGQVLKYNGTSWVASPDDVGGGATPTLSNGQILTGNGTSNSASTLTGDAVLAGGAITISNNAITSAKIADGSIAAADLNPMSATNGDVLKFNGTNWAPAAGTGTVYTGGTGVSVAGTVITNTGDTNATDDLTTASTAAGDVTGLFSNLQLAPGVVSSAEIADASIAAADLNAMSAANGDVLKFNGTNWAPAAGTGTVYTGGTGVSVAGTVITNTGDTNATDDLTTASTAAGDVTGLFSNLQLAPGVVSSAEIADASIVAADLNAMSAANGDVLKFNGTNWAPAAGTGTVYTGGTGITVAGTIITNSGDTNAADDLTTASTAAGDVTGLFSNLQLASGSVTSTEIADGTIAAADLNAMSATNGQVLKFNGTNWAPAIETGTTYTAGTGISVVGTVITNTGDANAADDLTTASTAAGDVTGLFSNLQLASGAVTSTEIADGSITGTDIAGLDAAKITTGILPVSVGGTGRNTWDGLLIGSGATISDISNGTVGQVLTIVGTSPSWQTPSSGWGLTGNATTNPATNYVGTSDLQPLVFRTNAVEAMRILSDGKVGIGIAAPTSKLDVVNATGIAIKATTSSNAANSYAVSGVHTGTGDVAGYFAATNTSGGVNSHGVYGQADGAGAGVFGASNGTAGNAARFMNMNAGNANPVVQIFNSGTGPSLTTVGAVGIGMTNPTQRLDVTGNVKFSGALMPNNLPGTAGQVLTSAGPGVPPTWNTFSGSTLISNPGTNNLFAGQTTGLLGHDNTFYGFSAGKSTTGTGLSFNTFIGSNTGQANTIGEYNTYLGAVAGYNATLATYNLFAGAEAGFNMIDGDLNTFVGFSAGYNVRGGNGNVLIGQKAGRGPGTFAFGNYNTIVGESAGFLNEGSSNTMLGEAAGAANTTGSQNMLIGFQADVTSGTLTNATAIGYKAKVSASSSLVLGGTGVDVVKVGIGLTAPTTELHVSHGNGSPAAGNGFTIQNNAGAQAWNMYVANASGDFSLYKNTTLRGTFNNTTGNYTPVSDRRFKKNIVSIESVLPKLMMVDVRRYHFKQQADSESKNIGVIAQEIKEVFPELVHYSQDEDRFTVDYMSMAPLAVKAIQEQQKIILDLQQRIIELESSLTKEAKGNAELKAQVSKLSEDMTWLKQYVLDQNKTASTAMKK